MLQSGNMHRLSRWWASIDSIMFALICTIVCIGAVLTATASPAVAERIGISSFHFLYRQLAFLFVGLCLIILLSTLSHRAIRNITFLGFATATMLMTLVLFIGDEANGAKRWMNVMGVSIQPSEILKPFYAVVTAFILSASNPTGKNIFSITSWNFCLCLGLHTLISILLLLQPDFGMTATISLVTAAQFFVAGLPLLWVFLAIIIFACATIAAYHILPHVASRIDRFLSVDQSSNYQVEKSIESYVQGGLFGRGPGEGSVKLLLPDSHTDFIFAVAGEEMGAIFCTLIVLIFIAILLRGATRISNSKDPFQIYAAVGILMYFGIQSIFNIGITVHLFPTKGMTLPFISYGGSSVLSFAIAIGIYLNLTKRTATYPTNCFRH